MSASRIGDVFVSSLKGVGEFYSRRKKIYTGGEKLKLIIAILVNWHFSLHFSIILTHHLLYIATFYIFDNVLSKTYYYQKHIRILQSGFPETFFIIAKRIAHLRLLLGKENILSHRKCTHIYLFISFNADINIYFS